MAKGLAWVLGIVFVVVGILGFMGTPIVGETGYFTTNNLHDVIHLVSGVLFIIVAMAATQSIPTVFKVFGIVYLVVGILGFLSMGFADLVMANQADHFLHLVLGVVIFGLGLMVAKKDTSGAMPTGMTM